MAQQRHDSIASPAQLSSTPTWDIYEDSLAAAAQIAVEAVTLAQSWHAMTKQLLLADPELSDIPCPTGLLQRLAVTTGARLDAISEVLEIKLVSARLTAPIVLHQELRRLTQCADVVRALSALIAGHDFSSRRGTLQFLEKLERLDQVRLEANTMLEVLGKQRLN